MQCRRPGSTRDLEGADSYRTGCAALFFEAGVTVYSRYTRSSMERCKVDEIWLDFIASIRPNRGQDECIEECRIGAAAPVSDTLRVSGVSGSWHPRHEIESASTCAA